LMVICPIPFSEVIRMFSKVIICFFKHEFHQLSRIYYLDNFTNCKWCKFVLVLCFVFNFIFTKGLFCLAPIAAEILAIFLGEIATKSGKMVY
jgi:hypothetical protein